MNECGCDKAESHAEKVSALRNWYTELLYCCQAGSCDS